MQFENFEIYKDLYVYVKHSTMTGEQKLFFPHKSF